MQKKKSESVVRKEQKKNKENQRKKRAARVFLWRTTRTQQLNKGPATKQTRAHAHAHLGCSPAGAPGVEHWRWVPGHPVQAWNLLFSPDERPPSPQVKPDAPTEALRSTLASLSATEPLHPDGPVATWLWGGGYRTASCPCTEATMASCGEAVYGHAQRGAGHRAPLFLGILFPRKGHRRTRASELPASAGRSLWEPPFLLFV